MVCFVARSNVGFRAKTVVLLWFFTLLPLPYYLLTSTDMTTYLYKAGLENALIWPMHNIVNYPNAISTLFCLLCRYSDCSYISE